MIDINHKEAAREALGISREHLDQELADLEDELRDAERIRDDIEEGISDIEAEIMRVKNKQEAKGKGTCPRCKLKQERDQETGALCCVKCGYCELEKEGYVEVCEYHGSEVHERAV